MLNAIRQFVKEEEGASAAEYALLLAIVAAGIAAAASGLGGAISTALTNATGYVSGAVPAAS